MFQYLWSLRYLFEKGMSIDSAVQSVPHRWLDQEASNSPLAPQNGQNGSQIPAVQPHDDLSAALEARVSCEWPFPPLATVHG
jgi:hypothetical protein